MKDAAAVFVNTSAFCSEISEGLVVLLFVSIYIKQAPRLLSVCNVRDGDSSPPPTATTD